MSELGLTNENMSKFILENNPIKTKPRIRNKRVVMNLDTLYNFWLIYIYENSLIKNQYIYADENINNLLKKEYKKYGGSTDGYLISTFLRILVSQIEFNKKIKADISKYSNELKEYRKGIIISD